jgi:cyclic pyranopterin phosphate synthase
LFSTVEWDARRVLRGGGSDDDLRALVRQCVDAKAAAHGIGSAGFHRPERAMYQIGG